MSEEERRLKLFQKIDRRWYRDKHALAKPSKKDETCRVLLPYLNGPAHIGPSRADLIERVQEGYRFVNLRTPLGECKRPLFLEAKLSESREYQTQIRESSLDPDRYASRALSLFLRWCLIGACYDRIYDSKYKKTVEEIRNEVFMCDAMSCVGNSSEIHMNFDGSYEILHGADHLNADPLRFSKKGRIIAPKNMTNSEWEISYDSDPDTETLLEAMLLDTNPQLIRRKLLWSACLSANEDTSISMKASLANSKDYTITLRRINTYAQTVHCSNYECMICADVRRENPMRLRRYHWE